MSTKLLKKYLSGGIDKNIKSKLLGYKKTEVVEVNIDQIRNVFVKYMSKKISEN